MQEEESSPCHMCEEKGDPICMLQGEESNPGPLRELAYWDARAARLNSLHDQLLSEKLKKVAKVLELARSSYYPAITRWG
jgi:dynein heavy chain